MHDDAAASGVEHALLGEHDLEAEVVLVRAVQADRPEDAAVLEARLDVDVEVPDLPHALESDAARAAVDLLGVAPLAGAGRALSPVEHDDLGVVDPQVPGAGLRDARAERVGLRLREVVLEEGHLARPEVRDEPLEAEGPADRPAARLVAEVAVGEELGQHHAVAGLLLGGDEAARGAEVADLARDHPLDRLDGEGALVALSVGRDQRLDTLQGVDREAAGLGLDDGLDVAGERPPVAPLALVEAAEVVVDPAVLGQPEGRGEEVAPGLVRGPVRGVHAALRPVEQRPAHAAVNLVDGVRVAVVAAGLDPQAARREHDVVLARVRHLLHQVEHARGAQVALHRVEDPLDRALGLLAARAVLEAVVQEQARRLVGEARRRRGLGALLGGTASVGVEECEQRVRVLVGPRPEEHQVVLGEGGLARGAHLQGAPRPIDPQAQVLEQADARDAEDAVGVDLDDGLGPEGDVQGQIEAAEAHGPDVPCGTAPGGRGAAVDEGVVAAAAEHEPGRTAVVPADRQPDHVVDEREGRDDRAVAADRGGGGRRARCRLGPLEHHAARADLEGHGPLLEHVHADGSDEGVLADLGRLVLGELLEEILVAELAAGDGDLELGEVDRDRPLLPVGGLGPEARGGAVVQLESVAPLDLEEQVDGDPVGRRRQVTGHHEAAVDHAHGDRSPAGDGGLLRRRARGRGQRRHEDARRGQEARCQSRTHRHRQLLSAANPGPRRRPRSWRSSRCRRKKVGRRPRRRERSRGLSRTRGTPRPPGRPRSPCPSP